MYQPGDECLDPEDLNSFIDLRERIKSGEFSRSDESPDRIARDLNCIDAINKTGTYAELGSIAGLGPVVDFSQKYGGTRFAENPLIDADAYSQATHGCRVGIVKVPAARGCDIELQLCGVAPVLVDFQSEPSPGAHKFAKPSISDPSCLQSSVLGSFEVLSRGITRNDGKTFAIAKFVQNQVVMRCATLTVFSGDGGTDTSGASFVYNVLIDGEIVIEEFSPSDSACTVHLRNGLQRISAKCAMVEYNKDTDQYRVCQMHEEPQDDPCDDGGGTPTMGGGCIESATGDCINVADATSCQGQYLGDGNFCPGTMSTGLTGRIRSLFRKKQ